MIRQRDLHEEAARSRLRLRHDLLDLAFNAPRERASVLELLRGMLHIFSMLVDCGSRASGLQNVAHVGSQNSRVLAV